MGLRTQKRRRRENKTDYKARRILLVSGLPRIVVRRTNKYFILQAVESVEAQDKVIATITSKDLLSPRDDSTGNATDNSTEPSGEPNNGWDEKKKGSLKSIPAGYLTGILFAKRLGSRKSEVGSRFIMDLGMARTRKGGRVFAVLAGLVEGGLDVSANDKVFPGEDRLMGEHAGLKDMVENCKNEILKVAGGRSQVAGTGAIKKTVKKNKEDEN